MGLLLDSHCLSSSSRANLSMAEAEWLLREKGQPEHASLSSHHAVEHCYGNGLVDEREQHHTARDLEKT